MAVTSAWARVPSDLAGDGAGHVSSLTVTLPLVYPRVRSVVWTGDVAGTSTCANWTSSEAQGRAGLYLLGDDRALASSGDLDCTAALSLYCLEQ